MAKKYIYPKDLSKIVMDSIEVPQVSTTKVLGVFVDDSLSWKEQTDYMRRKIHKSTGIIRRVRHLVTTECFLMLYYSLIYLYLSYCNIVWESTFPTTLRKNFVLQKHFVRIATRSNTYTSSASLFHKLQVFTVHDINTFQICVFMYKIYSSEGNIPEQFTMYFKVNSKVHCYLTCQFFLF